MSVFPRKKQQTQSPLNYLQSRPRKFTKSDFSGLAPIRRVLIDFLELPWFLPKKTSKKFASEPPQISKKALQKQFHAEACPSTVIHVPSPRASSRMSCFWHQYLAWGWVTSDDCQVCFSSTALLCLTAGTRCTSLRLQARIRLFFEHELVNAGSCRLWQAKSTLA